ncbi:MAG: type II toxin-antitoxin system VapC family toxin [Acidobacteria bacterium]|nr:type II toxin-antitoxin system VapC family toxin [Acidobacteriota bacterium]
MVVDSSALVAILLAEPEGPRLEQALLSDPFRLMSAASVLEVSLVLSARKGAAVDGIIDRALERLRISVRPVSLEELAAARRAFLEFGRGRHPAGLNYGDCFSYALAKVSAEPLLFKGADFSRTDLTPVLW